ncbi:MAG: hypothetical protein IJF72_00030 [Clostridia bacterium]|nr:hypothetical protein [Clostridia bacterium]
MIKNLLKDFNKSLWVVRIVCFFGAFLSNWQTVEGLCVLMGLGSWAFVITISAIVAVVTVVLFCLIVNLLVKWFHFYNLPIAEYNLVATAFFALYNVIFGLVQIVNFFTPIFSTWIGIFGGFIIATATFIGFYFFTSKMYFNTASRPRYFKTMAVLYVVVMSMGTLSTIWGGV